MDDVFYKRELNHNYMVLKSESRDLAARYEYRMMTENRIGKLLSCSQRQLDGEIWLYYDISSLQPVKRLYESKKLDIHELGRIVHAIADIQEDLSEYLMDEQGLMLDTDMLFTDIETEELYFCYDPGHHGPENRYAKLADFFLENVDHGQEPAVNAAYQFYKMSKSEYFVLSSFLPFLEKEQLRTTSNMERLDKQDILLGPHFTRTHRPSKTAGGGGPGQRGRSKKTLVFPLLLPEKDCEKKENRNTACRKSKSERMAPTSMGQLCGTDRSHRKRRDCLFRRPRPIIQKSARDPLPAGRRDGPSLPIGTSPDHRREAEGKSGHSPD